MKAMEKKATPMPEELEREWNEVRVCFRLLQCRRARIVTKRMPCLLYTSSLAEVDKKFVTLCSLEYPERSISVDTLYRKWNAVKADDMKALVDKRNKWKKGTSSIDETIWQAFLYYYLDEAQHPVTKCLEYTKMWACLLYTSRCV